MKPRIESIIIILFIAFVLFATLLLLYKMNNIPAYEESIIDSVHTDYVVLENGELINIDELANPDNIHLEGAIVRGDVIHCAEHLRQANQALLDKIKSKNSN